MSVKVASNRFIDFSLQAGFYQHLIGSIQTFQQLGDRLIREAELAQDFRQTNRLEDLGLMLTHLPLKEYRSIGQYYLGWSKYRRGEDAQSIFEKVIDESKAYKAKGLISLAAVMFGNNDYTSAVKCYAEAVKVDKNPSIFVPIARTLAVMKAMEGSHEQSLKDLENIFPLIRLTTPKIYYDYLNSYAVELAEAGRIEEAQKVCRITLASPYAFAYPEWRETEQDLALRGFKSRSSVRVIQSFPGNLVQMPEHEAHEPSATSMHPAIFGPAPVSSLKEWIEEKMVKEPNGNEELPEDMSIQEITMKILELITENKDDEIRLRKVLDYAVDLFSKKK